MPYFIILDGTVVNNAILIVHQSLHAIREGADPRSAIPNSVRIRIQTIFITTTITFLGLLPLLVFPGDGSELYRGLGAVVLGGLLVSTPFTFFLVPSFAILTLDANQGLRRWLRRLAGSDPRSLVSGVGGIDQAAIALTK